LVSFAQCDPLVVRYDGSNWWWGAFGQCKRPGGPTDRDAIFECAWNRVPAADKTACLKQRLRSTEQTRQAIDDVAAANGPANSCDRLVVKYERGSNWWWGAFGHCKQHNGTTNRNAIFECAWSQVPASDKTACLKERLRTTELTRQGIDEVAAFNGPANNCDLLTRRYDGSNWWWGAFGNCKRPGGTTDRTAVFECAWSQVPASDNRSCLKQSLRGTEQTRKGIDNVVAANGVIASNFSTESFRSCSDPRTGCPETCSLPTDGEVPTGYFAPQMPQELLDAAAEPFNKPPAHNIGANEGRLRADLRTVARLADPEGCSLHLSAVHNALNNTTLGRALADLSVTGRRSFAKFRTALPKQAYCDSLPTRPLSDSCPVPEKMPNPADVIAGCTRTLDRAYDVANFLRSGQSLQSNPNKNGTRTALGWIAVSGEDDAPHRPVNVPSSDFPQYDINVQVDAPKAQPPNPTSVTVSTRFVVAQSKPPAQMSAMGRGGRGGRGDSLPLPRWTLFADPVLSIAPNSDVLLFIHGMDSRAEEANDFIGAFFSRMAGSARNHVVIAVDLPTSGYADNLNYDRVSPLLAIGGPKWTSTPIPIPIEPTLYGLVIAPLFVGLGMPPPPPIIPAGTNFPDFQATGEVPLLDFIENFVVHFVDAVDSRAPIKRSIKAVMGGSLGGNMSLRLGRRPDLPWIPAIVAWSPASIWDSLGEGADLLKHLGPRDAWLKANNRDPNDPDDLTPQRAGLRQQFFGSWDKAIVPVVIPMAQSDTWTSKFYPCKRSAVAAARLDRHETYDARFQSWHWRLGAEQLLFSHQTRDLASGAPRYMMNYTRMLLMCGTEDNVPFNEICKATQRTAPRMTMTPGKAIFLESTGHSIDNERRDFFVQKVVEFLGLQ
jgi:hypothetical protein